MPCLPCYLDFIGGETEAQRGAETCLTSHSKEQAGLECKPKPGVLFLTPQYSPWGLLFSILELHIHGGVVAGARPDTQGPLDCQLFV